MASANGNRHYKIVTAKKQKAMEKLASGYQINRAADNAAGLSISEKMRGQIRGLNQAANNIEDGIGLIHVADGALSEVNNMLHRMTQLCVQAANDTNTYEDRQKIQEEIAQLNAEITKIGRTTEFNTLKLFDSNDPDNIVGSVTQLVSCPSADRGYLSEKYQGYPAATMDFSNINSRNIGLLNDQGFSFYCSQNCNEAFDFKLKTDGTPSSATDLIGGVMHKYVIDISECQTGKDIVDTMFAYVSEHLPSTVSSGASTPIPNSIGVSHSNFLKKNDSGNGFILYGNQYGMEYPRAGMPLSGKIDCSEITSVIDVVTDENKFWIQSGPNSRQGILISSPFMNAEIIGSSVISVLTRDSADRGITLCHKASQVISTMRANFGAYENRLEHADNNVQNAAENLQNAESIIRDADMAEETVKNSIQDILQQAGIAMITQANQSTQGILTLLK